MKVTRSWLAEFVPLPSDLPALRRTLDDLGQVVESVHDTGAGLTAVVVARVAEIGAIAGADRIRRVVADAGDGLLEIVCGATNFAVGDLVPLAPVGATLPNGMEIARRTLRGVTSNGMLCSGRELGLSEDHEGLLILDPSTGAVPGARLIDVLGLDDVVLEIAPEGNRPDAWSVAGVARDLAARLAVPFRAPAGARPNAPASGPPATTAVNSPALCGAITVGVVRGVTVTASPPWLRRRLIAVGQRPINNVVDASNYVMLELGQPTHPYDAARVPGRHLGVRAARPGETVTLLDGTAVTLGLPGRIPGDPGQDCVIVDGNDQALGLAGVMGGAASAITPATSELFLEAAFFDPMTIARTTKRLGLRTEASSRFERGVDPTLAERAIARFVAILRESSPDLEWLDGVITDRPAVPTPPVITVSADQVAGLLGTRVTAAECATLLGAIDFTVALAGDTMTVTPPPARLDVRDGAAGRADVIEEIARLYSYERLARRVPSWPAPGGLTDHQRLRRRVREALVGFGLLEAWTDSFVSDADYDVAASSPLRVRVANPLSSEAAVLRASLLTGLARAWGYNVDRGEGDLGLFEIGHVFEHPGWSDHPRRSRGGVGGDEKVELPTEREMVLALLGRHHDDARTAVATWGALAERLALPEVVVRSAPSLPGWHPTRFAALVERRAGRTIGHVGEIDPDLVGTFAASAPSNQRVGLLALDLDALADLLASHGPAVPVVPSRFPAALIDLALVTPDGVNAADLAFALRSASPLVVRVALFDAFRGRGVEPGTRSLAYAVTLGAPDRTLSEEEVAAARDQLIGAASAVGARLR